MVSGPNVPETKVPGKCIIVKTIITIIAITIITIFVTVNMVNQRTQYLLKMRYLFLLALG